MVNLSKIEYDTANVKTGINVTILSYNFGNYLMLEWPCLSGIGFMLRYQNTKFNSTIVKILFNSFFFNLMVHLY